MARTLSIKNIYSKTFKTFGFEGVFRDTLGNPETSGVWIIYGPEKHGKTWLSIKLAEYLSSFGKVLYISAEEGTGQAFVDTCKRVKLDSANRDLQFSEYIEIEKLHEKLSKRKAPKVVFLDNVTVYQDDLKYGGFRRLKDKHPNTLFVFVAHEERNEPYTATGKLIKKLANIIIRVQGLACFVSGRCPGGTLTIDEEKASLFHGHEIKEL